MNNTELPSQSLRIANPEFRQTILRHLERQEFMKHIGCRLTIIEAGYVEAEIKIEQLHEQQIGLVHGGVTATIADVAAGFAGFTLCAPDEHTVTAEIKISYFTPAKGGVLRAIGRVVKPGRSLHFCEADVINIQPDGSQKLIARATSVMAVIRPNSKGT